MHLSIGRPLWKASKVLHQQGGLSWCEMWSFIALFGGGMDHLRDVSAVDTWACLQIKLDSSKIENKPVKSDRRYGVYLMNLNKLFWKFGSFFTYRCQCRLSNCCDSFSINCTALFIYKSAFNLIFFNFSPPSRMPIWPKFTISLLPY